MIPTFLLVLTVAWTKTSYVGTEKIDSEIFICAEILSGALQTTLVVPFKDIPGTGSSLINTNFSKLSICSVSIIAVIDLLLFFHFQLSNHWC